MSDFISEDDLSTFDGWLRYQAIDATTLSPDGLADWRDMYETARSASSATPKVGLMKLKRAPNEHLYAVAVRENSDLWLTLWVRASPRQFFIFMPRGDRSWNVHASYHRDGRFHQKGHDQKYSVKQLQPLTGTFRGPEHLGAYMGHGPKSVGAICDPTVFSGVVEVAPGVLGPLQGSVIVDLVAPGCVPLFLLNVVREEVFEDTVPGVVIRIAS